MPPSLASSLSGLKPCLRRYSGAYGPMILESLPTISQMSRPEKMLLAAELWEEIAREDSEIPLTRPQMDELARRRERYEQHPGEVTTLEEIKARLLTIKRPA